MNPSGTFSLHCRKLMTHALRLVVADAQDIVRPTCSTFPGLVGAWSYVFFHCNFLDAIMWVVNWAVFEVYSRR